MARWRRSVWDELRRIHEEMDRLFERFSMPAMQLMPDERLLPGFEEAGETRPVLTESGRLLGYKGFREPLTDVYETDKEIIATLEIPGVEKKDIEINIDNNIVEVKVEKKQEQKEEDKDKGYYKLERSYSGFDRSFSLPDYAEGDKAKATYNNGVLEIRIPKKEEKKKGKKVSVE